jgi:hypothetical protein
MTMLYDPKWEQKTETQRLLNLAADLIERHGHAQRTLEDCAGRLCIGGAILKACTGRAELCPATHAMMDAYARMDAITGGNFVTWNNEAGREQAEVVAALREAALT